MLVLRRDFVRTLPLAWISMHCVTLQWHRQEYDVPLWGFPLPWAKFSGVSSLHWDLSISAALIDLLIHAVLLLCLLAPVRRYLDHLPAAARAASLTAQLIAAVWVSQFWIIGTVLGAHDWNVLPLSEDIPITSVTPCLAFDCYRPWE